MEAARADPARFEALYRKYVAQVYNVAIYELRDHHEAEDATERTFLQALTGLAGFQERAGVDDGPEASTFRIWLFQIARNVVAERRRSQRRHPQAGLVAAWRAVERLPDDRRRAIVLRFVHEMTTAEIAEVLGRSEGAVRVLLHRALRSVAGDLRRNQR